MYRMPVADAALACIIEGATTHSTELSVMNDSKAIIQRIRRINPGYQYLDLAIDDPTLKKIKPGQSLLARLMAADEADEPESWHPYLREQWWPVGYTKEGVLMIERPYSPRYTPGTAVQLLGPVGKPYRFRKSLRNVLLIAYDSVPTPLTIMTSLLLQNRISVTLVLLGMARDYTTDHLPPEIEVVRGEKTLDWPDMVMTLGWADQVFITVRPDDELFRFAEVLRIVEEKRTALPEKYIFGVFQPVQPCGVGACSACLVRVKKSLEPVCMKGPAFDLTEVRLPR